MVKLRRPTVVAVLDLQDVGEDGVPGEGLHEVALRRAERRGAAAAELRLEVLPQAGAPRRRVIQNIISNGDRRTAYLASKWSYRRADEEEKIQRRSSACFSIIPLRRRSVRRRRRLNVGRVLGLIDPPALARGS